ncbi:Integrator complex subunit 4 [Lamellibrachia satsuma]|nr:Integrator complex subunit 4 [Lamellibrachia satsuma]
MAALLKKRALAEYSQVIQEEAKAPPLKKLRLVHRHKVSEVQLDLDVVTSTDAFQALLHFEESLPTTAGRVDEFIRKLLERFFKEREVVVRVKIVALIGDLARTPGFDAAEVVDDLTAMIKSKESQKVTAQIIASLLLIGRSRPQNTKLHQQLVQLAVQNLHLSSHLVRCKCLELIGSLASADMLKSDGTELDGGHDLAEILGDYTQDVDPRVRTCAFQAMLSWHQRGTRLEQRVYRLACRALEDHHEGVRLVVVKLIWVLSQLYPESLIKKSETDEGIRMIDDGFAQICDMVNDLSMKVRTEAAGLLGSLHAVSPRFLEQTLDKKLMSNMRRKRNAHERQKEHYETGEWATGQKWADDAPREDVDPESVSLMSNGACGAFIHGLEDEYMEVRNAALDSLCELASQSAGFARLSEDFMVDMFNDEIETVRLNAINSLCKISHHIVLREDQLDIILNVLKDFSYEIRNSLRGMFSGVRVGTKDALNIVINGLLDNMTRYPQDRLAIWKCMRQLGRESVGLDTAPRSPTAQHTSLL